MYQKLLPFATQALFAQEDDCSSEDEAHGVQLQSFLDLAQKVGDVEPLHASVVQQISRIELMELTGTALVLAV